jgi:phosphatidylglycerol:prolipoprotein diacylglycerol transferase
MFPYLPSIFGVQIPLYGVMSALGYGAAIFYCIKKSGSLGIGKEEITDFLFYIILGALLGGKLFYVLFNFDSFAAASFLDKIRYGFVFFGGFLGALALGALYAKRKNISFLKAADFFCVPLALGHAIGRIGCFCAGCCYGKEAHGFWTVKFTSSQSLVPQHLHGVGLYPTQLMEAGLNFVLFLILLFFYNKKPKAGAVFALYVMGYSLIRFFIEFFRGDDRGAFIFGLSPSQIIALLLAAALGAVLAWRKYVPGKK